MKIHKAANVLPDMTVDEFAALKADIKTNGLLCPIERYEDSVIDGRHRLKACKELGIEPDIVDVDLCGQSPAAYVWSLNGARRHLSASQRAAVAVDMLPQLKAEAKQRMAAGGGDKKSGPSLMTDPIRDVGDSRDKAAAIVNVANSYVSSAEKLKAESPEAFALVKSGELTLTKATKKVKQAAKQKADKASAEKAKKSIKSGDLHGVYHGDSFELGRSIPDESCALIFTDPPYDRESLTMFSDLGMLASKILVDGGSLITFCGQYVLREVIELVAPEWSMDDIDERRSETDWLDDEREPIFNDIHLFWINCCLHTGGTAQMREYGIKVKWKPMLWFVKGKFRRDRETWVDDLIESKEEKDCHPWQQSVIEASYYIEKLTTKGELVVDPFCGGGTTAYAAMSLGRQWWTADVDATHVATARKRLA